MSQAIPWEYLGECSETSLQNFMLAQLNIAASLRKAIAADSDRLNEVLVNAEFARLLMDNAKDVARVADLRQGILPFKRRA